MLDERDLQAIGELMDRKLQPVQQDIQDLKESVEEIRGATNYMVEWIDRIEKKVDATA